MREIFFKVLATVSQTTGWALLVVSAHATLKVFLCSDLVFPFLRETGIEEGKGEPERNYLIKYAKLHAREEKEALFSLV